jgi:37-kD nucleoid-associated bacterial protein
VAILVSLERGRGLQCVYRIEGDAEHVTQKRKLPTRMTFENLTVSRIIIHEIFKRLPDGHIRPPVLSAQRATMSPQAMDVFRTRITSSLGSESQSMELAILAPEPDSAIQHAKRLGDTVLDADFINASAWFPNKLAQVQTSRSMPGGIVVVFDGTVGQPGRKFVGIIKAELSSGFARTNTIDITLVNDLFLGENAKLYKMGIFVRPNADPPDHEFPEGWQAAVYDRNIEDDRGAAARYFYEQFLGCAIPPDAASRTKEFYTLTKRFIKRAPLDEDQKNDILQALHTYLKVDQTQTVQVGVFSDQFMPPDVRGQYAEFMTTQDFPTITVPKDISEIATPLARRRIRFAGGVQVTGTMEAFNDYVTIQGIPEEGQPPDAPHVWTRITVKDRIQQQE